MNSCRSPDRVKLNEMTASEEAARCLLCYDAPCARACPAGNDPAKMIRSLRFENPGGAKRHSCAGCAESGDIPACEAACLRAKRDDPVRIGRLAEYATELPEPPGSPESVDLSIDFCGVHCENPFFLSSSVVASNYEMCARALEMGWAGVVFKTVGTFVPTEVSPRFDTMRKEGLPFIGFKNLEQISDHPLEENLAWMRKLKEDYPTKIIVASIMGQSDEEWTCLAKAVTDIGVDIIECNFSCPHMSGESLGSDVGQNPSLVRQYTAAVRRGTHLPVLAKMTPNIGNMEPPAIAAMEGGADGIAAINTIKSIIRVDLEEAAPLPSISGRSAVSGYSGKAVKPIALRFISDMARHPELRGVPLSGMGGIETWRDAAEFLMLGCGNLQITTAVMQYGYRIIDDLIGGLSLFLLEQGISSVSGLVGKALPGIVQADELDRSTVVFPVFDKEKCIGCGRCYVSCLDAGHQAIAFRESERLPRLLGKQCVGCHLCLHVCPQNAIRPGKRIPKPV